jgi:cell division inhibitor SepF
MGFFDRILDTMKLGDDDEDEYDDYYDNDHDYEDEEEEKRSSFFSRRNKSDDNEEKDDSLKLRTGSKVTPLRNSGRRTGGSNSGMEVCVFKPTSFDDSKEIADTLRADQTVILNFEGVDVALAQRITDFSTGVCYALEGNFQKISSYMFIATPHNVAISGDLQELVNSFDFNGIQSGI